MTNVRRHVHTWRRGLDRVLLRPSPRRQAGRATVRTWTHTRGQVCLDPEVRMLLSFQRPPRPAGKVLPSSERCAARSDGRQRTDQYSAVRWGRSTRPLARRRPSGRGTVAGSAVGRRRPLSAGAGAGTGACRAAGRAPSRRSAATSSSSAPSSSPSTRTPPCAISRRASERETPNADGEHRRQVDLAVGRADVGVVDLARACSWSHVHAVEVLLGAARGGLVVEARRRSPAPARAWRRAARRPAGSLDGQQLEPARPSPRRAGASSCRTSPRALGRRRSWLPSDFDIFSSPSMPGRIGIVSTHCSGWP